MRPITVAALFLAPLLVSSILAADPRATAPGSESKHVLVIGIDGCRSDALQVANTPYLDALIATGVVTYDAFAGGSPDPGDPTHQATSSGPGWSSICTGVWVDKHGVASNGGFGSGNFISYPHFFKRIRDAQPSSYLSSIVQWHPINQNLLAPFPGLADFTQNVADSGQAVENAAVAHLGVADPTALFLHFDDVDHAGHASGFSTSNSNYIQAIEATDAHIGVVWAAVQNRPNFANEDWLVIVTSDHGGTGTGHGGHSTGERRIWMIASGGAVPGGFLLPQGTGHTAVPPTALMHLEITIRPAWGYESEAFGYPDTIATSPVPGNGEGAVFHDALLSWFPGADAVTHEVYFGTQANLGAAHFQGSQVETQFDPGSLAPEKEYFWRIDTVTSQSTVVGDVWSFTTLGDPLDELVLAMDFEGDFLDHSGHQNDGVGVGNPQFTSGQGGQALDLNGNGAYVSLGSPLDLDFGTSTDFSVALWVRASNWTSDPVLASNKNWVSGSNIGWIIALDPNGMHWQWNYRGAAGTRLDLDTAGAIGDDSWHQIVISHDRDGDARFYQDGAFIGAQSLVGQGSIDSGLPTAVGQDGTLTYGVPLKASIDGMRIWRRTLGDSEVQALYQTGPRTFVGTSYCQALPNSAGPGALLFATGSLQLTGGDLQLNAVHLPAQVPGLFFTGPLQTNLPFGDGLRCVGGSLSRFQPPIITSSAGVASLQVDFAASPALGLFQPGTSWNFQFWHRDVAAQQAGFNLTDGLNVVWQ